MPCHVITQNGFTAIACERGHQTKAEIRITRRERQIMQALRLTPAQQQGTSGRECTYRIGRLTVHEATLVHMRERGLLIMGRHPQDPDRLTYIVAENA
jgi:hypothetical protein